MARLTAARLTASPSSTPRRPSRASVVRPRSRPTACSSTASSSRAAAAPFKTINPATEEVLAEVAEADDGRRRPRGGGRPQGATTRSGRGCPAPSAPSTSSGSPASSRSAARELAVLESLDNGKPIRESRDVDIPLAAAHFFYYAGWADKLGYAGLGPDPQPLGVAGQVIPWNFPLLMLAWKIAPALACGNTVVLKPAETTPLTALLFAEICQQADLPPGVVNIVTGAGDDRARRWSRTPASTRSPSPARPRSAARSPSRSPGTAQEGDAGARRQGREHRLRRRPDRPGGRGHRQRHLLQPGPRLLRRLAAAGAGVGGRGGAWTGCKRADGDAARRRPAGQEHRHRRDQLRRAAGPDPRAVRGRRGRGRRALVAAVRAARARVLVRADDLHRRLPGAPDRPRGDLRAGAVGADLPHPGRGGREGQQHAVRPVRRASGPTRARGSCGWPSGCGPAWSGPTRSTVRPDLAVRRLQGVRATAARAAATVWRPTSMSELVRDRIDVRKTYKLYIGGAFPRSESRPLLRGDDDAKRRVPRQRGAGLAQGRPRRGARGPRGVRRLVRARRPTTAARCSTGSPRCWRGAATSSRSEIARRRGRSTARRRARAGGRRDRPLGLVRRAGPTSSPRSLGGGQPGRRAVLQPLARPSRPAWSRVLAPAAPSLLGLVSRASPR